MKYFSFLILLLFSSTSFGQVQEVYVGIDSASYYKQIEFLTEKINNSHDSLKPKFYVERGQSKIDLGDYSGALKDIEIALSIDSLNCRALSTKGKILYRNRDKSNACLIWRKANSICNGYEEKNIKYKCDPNWDYTKTIRSWREDTTYIDSYLYKGEVQFHINSNLYYRTNDYEIYYDRELKELYQKRVTKGDSTYITDYYPNGQRKLENIELHFFTHGDSEWVKSTEWYPNGQAKFTPYNPNSTITTKRVQFFENGQVMFESLVNGKSGPDGYFKAYYSNGQLKASGQFVNAIESGTWVHFDENGKKIKEEMFGDEGLIETKEF